MVTGSAPARPVTFGIRLPNSGPFAFPESIRRIAQLSERLGFDTVWVHDHLAWPTHRRTHFAAGAVEIVAEQPPNFFESLTTLAYVAGATQRIQIGVAGLVLPWREPRVLAKQLATTAELSGGRLIPALAIGRFEDEFIAQEVPFHERGRITDEYLACLTVIFGSDPLTRFEGSRVHVRDAEYFPKPIRLSIWIGGMHPAAWRRVARYGQGWLPGGMTPEEYREAVNGLERALAAHQRTVREVECATEIFTAIALTDSEAMRIAEVSLRHQWGDVARGDARSLIGSVPTVRERIARYVTAGVTHFELKFLCHDLPMMEAMIEVYAKDVCSEFR
jgi:probable F420-dependent oxidoreductase